MSNIDVTSVLLNEQDGRIPSVNFITLGCAKNEVDSADMQRRLVSAGFAIVDDAEDADAVIVNTCSFIQAAIEESIDVILEVAGLANIADGSSKLIVAGCMPARFGDDLESELNEASAFVPCSKEDDIVEVVQRTLGVNPAPFARVDVESGPAAAYVKISDGCNRFCSFCSIPYIRGRYHSFPYERIRASVEQCIAEGSVEITLIGQDTGCWGSDFEEKSTTAQLLSNLAEEFPDTWFRIMYVEPDGITDELLDAIAAHDNVCDYLDMPLQHANPELLKSMRRKGSAPEFLKLLERIRTRVPGITLRTTLITGFPGETEEAFDELMEFLEEADFDYVGVFPYSREEGTRAYDLPDQVEEELKVARAQEVRDLCDAVGSVHTADRIGKELDVLVLGAEEDGQLFGRAMCQAPDVDGVVYVDGGEVGEIVRVTIVDTLAYDMEGEIIHG
ncbi:Ribosomal protein S12 methylthiotransferase RimO [Slackia heliotrinireducens]|uniref:Ribosomal protein uS12 methylthiotransferase RimO n=1 Tax=Slackia heliotrinireducens (strain ATCC 29202 / DSM 20476 / NCTC 11029 / RHS 1) TaxID=471855 RepID=C7N5C0_SLAHD|nr:30S ribosomal protein S12 methylthiotransferase RimO [Slackia heliotrinireducens]ACV22105.1 MiaB-like tRNA modifying enzyme YliG, TIGR01125 [Slackia heliotrinireducens DSM 20476]VEH00112.1 Ribosomal protein S12 methylthiotransferase RimO [Slackia heliotrinireducens]